jgi:hypothetical protein
MTKKTFPGNFVMGAIFKKDISSEELKKKAAKRFITPIDQAELACRLCEAVTGQTRPYGDTAEQAMDRMDEETRQMWLDAAKAAMGYIKECIMNSTEPH